MSKISSIFASPNHDNFQDLMRKNYKKGVKKLTQLSFNELATGHHEFNNYYENNNQYELDIDFKTLKDFNIVGFDILSAYSCEREGQITIVVAAAGSLTNDSLDYLKRDLKESDKFDGNWALEIANELERINTDQDLKTLLENLNGDFTIYIFKDGELYVFSSGTPLRADSRLNMSGTALAYSKPQPNRTLIKIDPIKNKLFPILTV